MVTSAAVVTTAFRAMSRPGILLPFSPRERAARNLRWPAHGPLAQYTRFPVRGVLFPLANLRNLRNLRIPFRVFTGTKEEDRPTATRKPVRVAMIGCGGMARAHLRTMLRQAETTRVAVLCEPNPEQLAATAALFKEAGKRTPPNQPDLAQLPADYGGLPARCAQAGLLDAAFICSQSTRNLAILTLLRGSN